MSQLFFSLQPISDNQYSNEALVSMISIFYRERFGLVWNNGKRLGICLSLKKKLSAISIILSSIIVIFCHNFPPKAHYFNFIFDFRFFRTIAFIFCQFSLFILFLFYFVFVFVRWFSFSFIFSFAFSFSFYFFFFFFLLLLFLFVFLFFSLTLPLYIIPKSKIKKK